MHNSRIIVNQFELFQPTRLSELFDLLSDTSKETSLMAGGTDLLPKMKEGRIAPKRVINTMKVDELDFIKVEDGILLIGASTRLKKVAAACRELPAISTLYQGVSSVGKLQILNMATMAGNICTASPAADTVPGLLTLDGSVTLMSVGAKREIPLKDFLVGPGKTAIQPGEILYCVNVPLPGANVGSEFKKVERVSADIAKINMSVVVERNGDVCERCNVAVGSCGPTTLLIEGVDAILRGQKISNMDDEIIHKAALAVAETIRPIDDVRSTAQYRRKVASVIFMDTFPIAWDRAQGDAS